MKTRRTSVFVTSFLAAALGITAAALARVDKCKCFRTHNCGTISLIHCYACCDAECLSGATDCQDCCDQVVWP
ncbi:MAG: hypothetical protein IT437_09245 [Phycisphaerales bacterium]|nr:hypothetical protein [Phycisphaerales bacterium]